MTAQKATKENRTNETVSPPMKDMLFITYSLCKVGLFPKSVKCSFTVNISNAACSL